MVGGTTDSIAAFIAARASKPGVFRHGKDSTLPTTTQRHDVLFLNECLVIVCMFGVGDDCTGHFVPEVARICVCQVKV